MREARLFCAGLVVAVCIAAPAALATPAAKPKRIRGSAAFSLQPAKRCVRSHTLKVKVRKVRHVHWLGAVVSIDGNRFARIKRKRIGHRIKLHGLPDRTFTFAIVATARNGRAAKATRTYSPCAPRLQPAPSPSPSPTPTPAPRPTATPTPTPTATPTPPATPAAGSYSGRTSQSISLDFYVSRDGAQVQDVAVPTAMACTPSRNENDQIIIDDIAIAADGSFSATTEQDGVWNGVPAHFTYTFRGHFNGTDVSGSLREELRFDDGTAYTCTSGDQSWTAARDSQGDQGVAPSPGSFSGRTSQSISLDFYVSDDHTQLQDVAIPTALGCAPSRPTVNDHIGIDTIPIATDGSFTSTTEQDGYLGGVPAHFTYRLRGHLHGLSSNGTMRAAGSLSEDVSFDDGASVHCGTNEQYWFANRDTQGTQGIAPSPGSYSGRTNQSISFDFYVSDDHTQLQDVAIPTALGCAPSRPTVNDHIGIDTIPIATDGSFTSTTEQDGVLGGVPVHFTYRVRGHFHGLAGNSTLRAAGTLREDITYDDGTTVKCSTNDQFWFANRDTQGTQGVAPPPGSYSGRTNQSISFGFTVASGGTELQDVSIPTALGCSPSHQTVNDHIVIDEIPIATNGSFSAKTESDGVVSNAQAHFTYTFRGHFHGLTSSGVMRTAGTLREDVTFDDGTSYSCTTNDQFWFATRSP